MLRVLCLWLLGILLNYYWDVPLATVLHLALAGIIISLLITSALRSAGILWIAWLTLSVFYNKPFFAFKHAQLPRPSAMVVELNGLIIEKPKTWEVQAQIQYWKINGTWEKAKLPWKMKAYFSKKTKKPNLGQIWLLADSLQLFERPLFPQEKNWFEYYKERGLAGRIFVRQHRAALLRPFKKTSWLETWKRLQSYFLVAFSAMPHAANREVAEAMVLGETKGIDSDLQAAYTDLGAVHILSVSGMHLGILFWVLNHMFSWVYQRIRVLKMPIFLFILTIIWLYAGITGFSAPVLRASMVFSFMLLAQLLNRPFFAINLLATSCWVLLLFNPLDLFQAGFSLSYLAVLGILSAHKPIDACLQIRSKKVAARIWNLIWEATALAISAQLLTFPLVIYYFHQLPQIGLYFLLNPVLMVLSSIALVASFALLAIFGICSYFSIPGLWQWWAYWVDYSYDGMHQIMLFFSATKFPPHSFLYLSWVQLLLVYLSLASIFSWWCLRKAVFIWGFTLGILLLFGWVIFRNGFQNSQKTIVEQVEYRKELVVYSLSNRKLYVYGPSEYIQDRKWFSAHLTPFAAYYGVLDTVLINKKTRPFGPGLKN